MSKNLIAYKILLDKPEGKTLLGKPSCQREGNTRMDPEEVEGD
jgi:hypothetical protein